MSPRMSKPAAQTDAMSGTTIATVERAVDVLFHIANSSAPDFGITELADELSMSKAGVHRVLATLKRRGLIEVEERTRRYSLGVGALRLGLAYLDRIDVRRMGRPAMERLSEQTGETATLSVLLGEHERIYVDQVTPDREVILSVTMGEPYPLHAGASGQAFLAFLPDEARNAYLSGGKLKALTDRTVVKPKELSKLLDEVRARGWSQSSGQRKAGASSVAAPVRSHDGFPIAVVSICGQEERFNAHLEECREQLLKTAEILSRQFGWTG